MDVKVNFNSPYAVVDFNITAIADIPLCAPLGGINSASVTTHAGAVDCSESSFDAPNNLSPQVGSDVQFYAYLYDIYGNHVLNHGQVCLTSSPALNEETQHCVNGTDQEYNFDLTDSDYTGSMTFTPDICASVWTATVNWQE